MNGTHEGVSGYTISTSFTQVDGWSTGPPGFIASQRHVFVTGSGPFLPRNDLFYSGLSSNYLI